MEISELVNDDIEVLDVPSLQPAVKHATVFAKFDELKPGEAFYIINDHDPKPLYYQMIAERGNTFSWIYSLDGPEDWKVLIKKNEADSGPTLGELVAADIRNADVFKKRGLDFCCGGKKTLKQACEEKGIDQAEIESELEKVRAGGKGKATFDFNKWNPGFLADYIFNEHHQYWYNEEPILSQLVEKVAGHHGNHFSFLKTVESLYTTLRHELNAHFLKEERVLFPYIKQLVTTGKNEMPNNLAGIGSIQSPIQMMEADHESAGSILEDLRKATSDYSLPAGACNSFALLYHKLENLEEDLHQHIHLENNILFPKAILLEKQLNANE